MNNSKSRWVSDFVSFPEDVRFVGGERSQGGARVGEKVIASRGAVECRLRREG